LGGTADCYPSQQISAGRFFMRLAQALVDVSDFLMLSEASKATAFFMFQ
jgi:hypothetical protein